MSILNRSYRIGLVTHSLPGDEEAVGVGVRRRTSDPHGLVVTPLINVDSGSERMAKTVIFWPLTADHLA